MWKVIVFWGGIFCLFFKKHNKIGISAHFLKQKDTNKLYFLKLLSGESWKLLSGPSWARLKKRQLGPDNNFHLFARNFLFSKNVLKPLFSQCFLAIGVLEKTNLDQITTSKTPKLGPDNNFTAYTYVYVYMLWSNQGGHVWPFQSYQGGQVGVIGEAKFVFSQFLQWFQAICCTLSYRFLYVFVPNYLAIF